MRSHTKAAAFLFLACSSVYVASAIGQTPSTPVDPAGPAVVSPADPFAATPVEVNSGKSVTDRDVTFDADNGTVEIHVNEAPLVEVLRMLSIQSERNIIASKEVRGTVTANLYGVTVREALDAILHANGYAYREKGNFIYVYTLKEIQEQERANRQTATEVIRLYYTPAANAVNMIKPVLSGDAQVSFTTPAQSGIQGGLSDLGGNSHAVEDIIVVNDYPENLERVRKIIKEVDRRPQQILIEATIIRAALSDDNALGVDFNILAGVDFSQMVFNTSGQGVNATPGTGTPDVGSVGTGNNFTQNINGGLRVGFVSDNVSVFLSALEGVTDTNVLANPKVLALNKQRGEVIVGRKDGYYTTTVTESSTVQTVEFLETGTKLYFRPFIGDDGYIRMEIHPEDSSGGLTSANLPFKITTEVTSNVMIKDGHTIVIGGLFREASDTSRSQVPILGNIPYAGTLFRQQRDRTAREEIIILLTPHIIKNDSAYAALSAEQLRHAELLRVGVRQGMMFSGRERLAEGHYRAALDELAKPDAQQGKALWHLNCAINLNPKFTEALKLREELTGKQIVASDNSSIRRFVRDAILVDVASPEAPATQPVSEPVGPTQPALAPASIQPTETASAPTTQPTQTAMMPTTQPTDTVVNSVADATHGDDPSDPCDNNLTQWWDDFSLRASAEREPWRGSFGWLGQLFTPKPFDPESLRLKQDEPSSSPKVVVTELTEDDANAGVDTGK
jgi:type IV pilus assembly protein PilQ